MQSTPKQRYNDRQYNCYDKEDEEPMSIEKRLFFLGAGSIAEAMIKGLLTAHLLEAQNITASCHQRVEHLQELSATYGVRMSREKEAAIAEADIILLAVKPYNIVAALEEVAHAISARHVVISLVAGVTTEVIESYLPAEVPVLRAMPNTSSFVQQSATALSRGRWATGAHLELGQLLFSAIGTSVIVDESLLNAVTGLSGSGPAYFYYIVEALLQAGVECGLSEETSRALLLQTLTGAAQMLKETGKSPVELRRQVTSPNGTTMAGIAVLEQGNVRQMLIQAAKRATQRAEEMGRETQPHSSLRS
jgi:pyrroline-5-carboxylate reductase